MVTFVKPIVCSNLEDGLGWGVSTWEKELVRVPESKKKDKKIYKIESPASAGLFFALIVSKLK